MTGRGSPSRWVLPCLLVLASGCDGGTPPAQATPTATATSATTAAEVAATDAGGDADADADADAGEDADAAADAADAAADAWVEPTCPDDMVRPGRFFCVDRYEGHLVVVGPDGAVTPHPHYEVPESGVTYWARSEKDVFPQAYISRTVAQAACKAAGKRLCSREEWMRGCRGPKGWTFPYGNRRKAKACNSSKDHLLQQMFGSNPKKWSYNDVFNNPKLAQEPGYLAVTGFFPECLSADGAYDMVGNLHEWVSDSVGEDVLEKLGARQGRAQRSAMAGRQWHVHGRILQHDRPARPRVLLHHVRARAEVPRLFDGLPLLQEPAAPAEREEGEGEEEEVTPDETGSLAGRRGLACSARRGSGPLAAPSFS